MLSAADRGSPVSPCLKPEPPDGALAPLAQPHNQFGRAARNINNYWYLPKLRQILSYS
tara:strand:+ start:100 stop:273 length:174 start_codon:yes stop_codon:yes gene_type:complete